VTVACCPWCGAEYGVAATKCWDCKLALGEPPAATLPETTPDEEVGFELDEWSAADRGGLAASLGGRGIDYRWEPGLVLVVRADDEAQVDSLLDDLESGDDDERGERRRGWDESAAGDDDEDGDEESGERAQAAMADLFVAADRLMHGPGDDRVADDLIAATAVVSASVPPYGFEPVAWLQIRELAAGVVDVLQAEGADETVMLEARSLREALRPYV
jgi:hypothetical protein